MSPERLCELATTYHANFKSIEPRPGRRSNSIVFCAAGDTEAAAVAAELTNWTTGKLTSLTKNVTTQATGGPDYPVGTRRTAKAYVVGADGGVWRVRIRNISAVANEIDIANLLGGTNNPGGGVSLGPLGAPPLIPGTDTPVVAVTGVTINTLK